MSMANTVKERSWKHGRSLIIVFLAIGYTCFCVHKSFREGRLSNVPSYDDVVYFSSGTDLLESIREDGRNGLASFLARDDLHSPYSTALAAFAFWVGGYEDASPYMANIILLTAYLFAVAYFVRGCRLADFCLALWIALMLPFASMAVAEFRPDIAWATITGFTVVFTLTQEQFFEKRWCSSVFGVLAGLNLLIKPTTFAMTILVLSAAFLGRWLVEFARTNSRQAWRALPAALLAGPGLAVLIASPYYAFHWKHIWDYFYANSYGKNAGVWAFPGDRRAQWTFYIGKLGARSNFGCFYWAVSPSILGLSIWHFVKSTRVGRLQTALLWLIVSMVYAVNSMANAKTVFLGGAFYGILIFSACYFAGGMLRTGQNWPNPYRYVLSGVVLGAAIIMTLFYEWPDYSHREQDARSLSYITAWRGVEQSLPLLPAPKKILATQSTVAPENVNIWYLRRHVRPLVVSCAFVPTLDRFRKALDSADVVIAQDKGTLGGSANMPAEPLQDDFVRMLRESSAFGLKKLIPIADGKNVYVFVRTGL